MIYLTVEKFLENNSCQLFNRVAAQDSLNVGDLYNLLFELGYLLIADEL